MDAADHSVGDYGRTDGTGCNLVHRYVERRGIRLSSGAPVLSIISLAEEFYDTNLLIYKLSNIHFHSSQTTKSLGKAIFFASPRSPVI